MRSRTSSCNRTLLKKDLTRFAPLWLGWCLMFLVGIWLTYDLGADLTAGNRSAYSSFLSVFALASFFYGFACAAALFGGLHKKTECVSVHALPVRRETWFAIHTLAAMLMSAVPAAVFCAAIIPQCGNSPLLLFLGMQAQFVFFFGLGTLCMMLTGRLLAAVLLYGLINALPAIVLVMLELVYLPLLPGVRVRQEDFFRFCPLYTMMANGGEGRLWRFGADYIEYLPLLGVFALIGLVLLAASLLLYRRRKLEFAGDFLAVKALQPVFVAVVAVVFGFVGAVLALLSDHSEDAVVLMTLVLIGVSVGHLAALMLIRRTARVLNARSLCAVALTVLAVGATMFAAKADVLGRVNWVPEESQVASVELKHNEVTDDSYITDDPAQVAELIRLHTDILESELAEDGYYGNWNGTYLAYRMNGGARIYRYYKVKDPELIRRMDWYYSQPEMLLGVDTLEDFMPRLKGITLRVNNDFWELPQSRWQEVCDLVFREMEAGKMVVSGEERYTTSDQEGVYHKNYSLEIELYNKSIVGGWSWKYVSVPTTAEATQAWIAEYTASNAYTMTYDE